MIKPLKRQLIILKLSIKGMKLSIKGMKEKKLSPVVAVMFQKNVFRVLKKGRWLIFQKRKIKKDIIQKKNKKKMKKDKKTAKKHANKQAEQNSNGKISLAPIALEHAMARVWLSENKQKIYQIYIEWIIENTNIQWLNQQPDIKKSKSENKKICRERQWMENESFNDKLRENFVQFKYNNNEMRQYLWKWWKVEKKIEFNFEKLLQKNKLVKQKKKLNR